MKNIILHCNCPGCPGESCPSIDCPNNDMGSCMGGAIIKRKSAKTLSFF